MQVLCLGVEHDQKLTYREWRGPDLLCGVMKDLSQEENRALQLHNWLRTTVQSLVLAKAVCALE